MSANVSENSGNLTLLMPSIDTRKQAMLIGHRFGRYLADTIWVNKALIIKLHIKNVEKNNTVSLTSFFSGKRGVLNKFLIETMKSDILTIYHLLIPR